MRHLKIRHTLFLIISIVILVAGGVLIYRAHLPKEWDGGVYYGVIVGADTSTFFNLSIPAALNETNSLSPLMTKITCTGNCSWFIRSTDHGTALNLIGSGNITIGGKIIKRFKTPGPNVDLIRNNKSFFHFDMWADEKSWDTWVWSDHSSTTAILNITMVVLIDNISYEFGIDVSGGWERVRIAASQVVP